jgi:hypothetical protein
MAQTLRQHSRLLLKIIFGLGIVSLGTLFSIVGYWWWGFFSQEPDSRFAITWNTMTFLLFLLLLSIVCLGGVGISYLLRSDQSDLIIRIYFEGMDESIYQIIEAILRKEFRGEVALYPLTGGFVATLYEVHCPGRYSTVLKLGQADQIREEADNYRRYVYKQIATTPLWNTAYRGRQGALLYPYATLTHGRSKTFEELYSQASDTDQVTTIINRLFHDTLKAWFDIALPDTNQCLYQDYGLNGREWNRIEEAIKNLGLDPGADSFPKLHLSHNPLKAAKSLFDERQGWTFETKLATVHGDLNARNILLDSNNNIFLIDFAKTGKDHFLRDFCRLEVEIKFVLTRLSHDEDVEVAVDFDRKLLLEEKGQPFSTWSDLLTVSARLNGYSVSASDRFDCMLKSIKVLRQSASDVGMLGIDPRPDQYYIGLLHYTLDALRYQQCGDLSKRFAIQSVATLCQALNPDNNQLPVH